LSEKEGQVDLFATVRRGTVVRVYRIVHERRDGIEFLDEYAASHVGLDTGANEIIEAIGGVEGEPVFYGVVEAEDFAFVAIPTNTQDDCSKEVQQNW